MLTVTEALGNRKPAIRTADRSAFGVDGDRCATSFFRFVAQDSQEVAPRGIGDTLCQSMILEHVVDPQVLVEDEIVVIDKPSGSLMSEILSLSPDLQMRLGDKQASFAPTAGTSGFSGKHTLPLSQHLLTLLKAARILDNSVRVGAGIGERSERRKADIHPDVIGDCALRWGVPGVTDDDGVPLAADLLDGDRLDLALSLAMQLDLNPADVLDTELVGQGNAIAICRERHRIEPISALEARISRLLAALAAFEKRLECLIETAEDILSSRVVKNATPLVFLSDPLNLVCLIVVVNRNAVSPCVSPLLKGGIVEKASDIKQTRQSFVLASVRIQTKNESLAHLLALLFLDVTLDSLRRDVSSSADIVRARPEVRQSALEGGELFTQLMCAASFNTVHDLLRGECRGKAAKQVYVIWLDRDIQHLATHVSCLLSDHTLQPNRNVASQYTSSELRYPDEVIIHVVGYMSSSFTLHKLMIPHLVKRKEEGAIPRPR